MLLLLSSPAWAFPTCDPEAEAEIASVSVRCEGDLLDLEVRVVDGDRRVWDVAAALGPPGEEPSLTLDLDGYQGDDSVWSLEGQPFTCEDSALLRVVARDVDGGEGSDEQWWNAELGTMSGDCRVFDVTLLEGEAPELFSNTLALTNGFDERLLSEGGLRLVEAGTLGGSSIESEVVAYEALWLCEGALLVYTEEEIPYGTSDTKKADLVAEVEGYTLGVSVVRAFEYADVEGGISVARASAVLTGKLEGMTEASLNTTEPWDRSVVSVVAYGENDRASILAAWDALDPAVKDEHLVVVTVTDGDDGVIYNQ